MFTPRRIALVSAFPPGLQSLNEYGFHLAKGLAARADVAEVVVLADTLPNPQAELDLGPKITVRRCWTFNRLGTVPRILAALRRDRVDGVIWNLQTTTFGDREVPAALGLFGPMAARLTGTTSGVIAHNLIGGVDLDQTVLKGQPLRQKLVQAGGRVVTAALLRASYMTVTLRNYFDALAQKAAPGRLFLVPHGTFDAAPQDIPPFADRPNRIVTMGKFGTYKRLDTLLAAFDILRQDPQHADMELVIGGADHPNTPGYMARLAQARKADKGVIFKGYIAEEEVAGFFANARLSVFDYSATTGSSGVLHQTASSGAVPVFPRIGDFVDICEDEGISGVNYCPQDPDDMARAMGRALADPQAAQTLAEANLKAAMGFPFSGVIDFHLRALCAPRRTKRRSTCAGGPIGPIGPIGHSSDRDCDWTMDMERSLDWGLTQSRPRP